MKMHDIKDVPGGLCTDRTTMQWLFENFGKAVMGSERWKKKHKLKKISEFVTVANEAFLLLVLENNEKRWRAEFEIDKANKDAVKNLPDLVHMRNPLNLGQNLGWEEKGIKHCNELVKHVLDTRKLQNNRKGHDGSNDVETQMMEEWNSKGVEKKKSKVKDNSKEMVRLVDRSVMWQQQTMVAKCHWKQHLHMAKGQCKGGTMGKCM